MTKDITKDKQKLKIANWKLPLINWIRINYNNSQIFTELCLNDSTNG